jgi:ATP phosphoribosyltransferase
LQFLRERDIVADESYKFSFLYGINDAIVGLTIRDTGESVAVYDLNIMDSMFRSKEEMIDWIISQTENLPEEQQPVFIRCYPALKDQMKNALGTLQ